MAFVVTASCIRCKYTYCVDVCPVDCFREGPNMLVIGPDECIDCAICVPECPVDAIYAERDVPAHLRNFVGLNVSLARSWQCIASRRDPLPDADRWTGRSDKRTWLEG